MDYLWQQLDDVLLCRRGVSVRMLPFSGVCLSEHVPPNGKSVPDGIPVEWFNCVCATKWREEKMTRGRHEDIEQQSPNKTTLINMTGHGDCKWMVSIADENFSTASRNNASKSNIIELNDPSTQESRQYIQLGNHHLLEIQSLESDFSSFFVGRHVVKDGNLYVINRVDPLFWFFSHYSPTEKSKQWRPMDQVVECLPDPVQKALDTKQVPNLFQELISEAMGDTPVYKFVAVRALKWLQKKHERIYQCLERQEQAKREKSKSKLNIQKSGGGSVSSSFYIPDEDPVSSAPQTDTTTTTTTTLSDTDLQQLKLDSAHIILNYLPSEWSNCLLDHLGLADIHAKATTNKPKPVQNKPVVSPDKTTKEQQPVAKPNKKVVQAQTIGNKRLAKVNTKGMKSLSSFFGAPKKKKKVQ